MNVLVACEFSGVVREAFRLLGHDAWSCDLLPAEDGSQYHIQADVRTVLNGLQCLDCDEYGYIHRQDRTHQEPWDLMIAHPPCTRLTNSGVRWLHVPPKGRTKKEMWNELDRAAEFYLALRNAPIPRKALENPIMHRYAMERIGRMKRQIVQPWWFGDPEFKATGFELIGLPELQATNRLIPPKSGTREHAQWSKVHRASPGPDRWKERSRTLTGIASAMAEQWGSL